MSDVPTTMNAMVLSGHGGMDMYHWHEDWPVPECGPDDVIIKVGACGMNNTDVNTRSGWYSKAVVQATTGDAMMDARWQTTLDEARSTHARVPGLQVFCPVPDPAAPQDVTPHHDPQSDRMQTDTALLSDGFEHNVINAGGAPKGIGCIPPKWAALIPRWTSRGSRPSQPGYPRAIR